MLAADCDLDSQEHLLAAVEGLIAGNCVPLVIAARSIRRGALALLTVNKLRGILPVLAVRVTPENGNNENPFARIAAATRSTLLQGQEQLAALKPEWLGRADRVISSRSWTIIIP